MYIQSPSFAHRHWVAFPVFLGLLTVSLFTGLQDGTGVPVSTVGVYGDHLVFSLPVGSTALLKRGDILDLTRGVPDFRQGSMLVSAPSTVKISAGVLSFQTIGGAFHIVRQGANVTVTALTAPVLVSRDASRMIVPVGTQWKGSAERVAIFPSVVLPVPGDFVVEQISILRSAPLVDVATLLPPPARAMPKQFAGDSALRFAKAEKRSRNAWALHAVGYLRFLVEGGDADAIRTFLAEAGVADALRSLSTARQQIAFLLSRAPENHDVLLGVLPLLAVDRDAWLTFSFHPRYRDAAWALPLPAGLPVETRAVRIMLLPQSDVLSAQMSDFVIQRWKDDTIAYLAVAPRLERFLNEFLQTGQDALTRLNKLNYPERAQRLQVAVGDVLSAAPSELSLALKGRWRRFADAGKLSVQLLKAQSSAAPVRTHGAAPKSAAPVLKLSPDEIRSRTTQALRTVGALFTIQTQIQAISGTRAAVTSIAFSSPKHARLFTFVFDVETGQVSQITEGGETMLYAMSLDEFVQWVGKGE